MKKGTVYDQTMSGVLKLEPVKSDDQVDVMLLQLPPVQAWKAVAFGDCRSVPEDAELYSLGFPGNNDLSSAIGRLSNKYGPRGIWQTTLPINRGHSGGPVFDQSGRVVAIASAGSDVEQQVTFAIPECYAKGLTQMAAAGVHPSNFDITWVPTPGDLVSKVTQKFTFYKAVDHDAQVSAREVYCLPDNYRVTKVEPSITTKNGPETKLMAVTPDPRRRNCVALTAFIKGAGVVKFGPIIVDHKGRGWLGVDLLVDATKTP